MFPGSITDVKGIMVGHDTDKEAMTGCTAILAKEGAVGGVDVRGGSPGTRETDAFSDRGRVPLIHSVLLTGGSAFGLAAAQGVMDYLEEEGIGFDTGVAKVPLVGAAVIFDLACGRADVRPTAQNGYFAAQNATENNRDMGIIGAGTGAMVGKMLGPGYLQKGGLGTASIKVGKATVGAMVAVNAVGNIHNHHTGEIIAGVYDKQKKRHLGLEEVTAFYAEKGQNTTICCIATDAVLDKQQTHRLAMLAHDGFAMAIRPVHTQADGDTAFAMVTGKVVENVDMVLAVAAEVTARAIVNGVLAAQR
ncbi:P1 family peptidase [Eubacteriales bacterium OttesenSCG-928-M02]|nr:P1 family peptidase [Eubacteriales bacterium OttesenSCG-928-M02]